MAKVSGKKKALVVLALFLTVNVVVCTQLGRLMNTTRNAPPYPASDAAKALHARLLVADMHADTLLWGRDLLTRASWGHVDVPRLVEGNVALQGFTVITENAAPIAVIGMWPTSTWTSMTARALYQVEQLHRAAGASGGKLTVITSRDGLDGYLARRAGGAGMTAGFLGVEGTQSLDGDLGNLQRLYDAGFRMVGLAHFSDNEFSGSSSGARKGGLTEQGRELVRRAQAMHMLIDLAHASPQTINDVMAVATRPVLVSHTGVQGTCQNARNLSDDELKRIAQGGGVIGIGYWDKATCGTDVNAIAAAIRYAANLVGAEHVGLGSDFDGGTDVPFDASGLVQLTDALLSKGFSEEEVAGIMGGNVIRLLRENLP